MEYCEVVLNNSNYPDNFPKNFECDYTVQNKLLIIDYSLPEPDLLPRLSEVRYIASKKEFKEIYITDIQFNKNYDSTIFQIALRTLYEIFKADIINAIEVIVFNGRVESINKGTGKNTNNCILSLQVTKDLYNEIELSNVNPRICFKNLKGVSSSKLFGLTAIMPIVQINKNDRRFVSCQDLANNLESGINLASMNWEDLEHLIREIFEKEFIINGGEVKATRASRYGGVDAIAFDPDPIRGGKIAIQAKRYSNTVGVSEVQDLYGTVLSEGATKGI